MENRIKIDDCFLSINLPETFAVMSEEDVCKMGKKPAKNDFAIHSVDKHIIYEVAWKKMTFLAKIVSIKTIASESEKRILSSNPVFKKIENTTASIDGEQACGFTYTYEVSGIKMVAELLWVKHGALSYAINCIAREAAFYENPKAFEEEINSIRFEKC